MTLVSSLLAITVLYNIGSVCCQNETAPSTEVPTSSAAPLNKSVVRELDSNDGWTFEDKTPADTRRILYGKKTLVGKRPYMVYMQLTKDSSKAKKYRGWLCGGIVVHSCYVLTSAACVEDADHFYVVSGTTKYVDSYDYKKDNCVCKHRRKVVWKCVPKNYKFDFNDTSKWSANDIAIVKVNRAFKIGVTESGCEFGVEIAQYNNISRELEQPGTKGWISGWGSMGTFREGVYRRAQEEEDSDEDKRPANAKVLQEAKVIIMDNEQCAKRWAVKYRNIITEFMICTRDVSKRLSEVCNKKYANCTEIDDGMRRRFVDEESVDGQLLDERGYNLDLGRHLLDPDSYSARRTTLVGGFCENDHGGPLIVKYKNKDRAIGVISACKIDPKTHSCHGPFLYTSIFKNRQFISCAIYKDIEQSCRRVFRAGITHDEWSVDWSGVPSDGNDDLTEGDGHVARSNLESGNGTTPAAAETTAAGASGAPGARRRRSLTGAPLDYEPTAMDA